MKSCAHLLPRIASFLAACLFASQAGLAQGADLRVLIAAGLRPAMEELGPQFENASGHKLSMSFAPADAVTGRAAGGEAAHVIITSWEIDTLAKGGLLVPGSVTILARARLGLAVRAGMAKPDIATPESLKRVLLAASSVAYLNPAQRGDSGYHFMRVLDRLGIADDIKRKAVIPGETASLGALLAKGEADIVVLALQHIAFISSNARLDLVGPLPGELQESMVFSAGIFSAAGDRDASEMLLNFLRSSEATSTLRAKGLDPAVLHGR